MPTKPVREVPLTMTAPMPPRTIGELTTQEGEHRGWIVASDAAVIVNVQPIDGVQVLGRIVMGKVTDLGPGLYCLSPVVAE